MSCVQREIVLPVPRERAWELITEPGELAEWLAEDVEFEAEEGAPLRADDRAGIVEEVEPGERIVFAWGDSRVEWRLDDHPAGTRFTVVETRESFAWGPRLTALTSAAALCPA
ncbi:MAG: SRPBCC family protein [Solirubrobacteraceae bacterium]